MSLLGSSAVMTAIAVHQGRLQRADVLGMVLPSMIGGQLNVTLALVVLLALRADATAAGLVVVLGGLFAGAYRGYAVLLRKHRTLGQLYEFTRIVEQGPADSTALAGVLLDRARRALRAEWAALRLVSGDEPPEPVLAVASSGEGRLAPLPD